MEMPSALSTVFNVRGCGRWRRFGIWLPGSRPHMAVCIVGSLGYHSGDGGYASWSFERQACMVGGSGSFSVVDRGEVQIWISWWISWQPRGGTGELWSEISAFWHRRRQHPGCRYPPKDVVAVLMPVSGFRVKTLFCLELGNGDALHRYPSGCCRGT